MKNKTFELKLVFDSEKAAHGFVAYWLDGGGQPDCLDFDTVYEESDDWVKGVPKHLRIKGTGNYIDEMEN